MQGLAQTDKVCLVCGGMIKKGVTVVKYSPVITNSERCGNCYGKPDKFPPPKVAVSVAPDKDQHGFTEEQAAAISAYLAKQTKTPYGSELGEGISSMGDETQATEDVSDDEGEADGDEAGEYDDEPVKKKDPKTSKPKPSDKPAPEPKDGEGESEQEQPPPDDDFFKMMVDALTPPVTENVTKSVLDKAGPVQKKLDSLESSIKDAKDVFQQANEGMQALDSALAKALAKFDKAEAGKSIVDLSVVLPDGKEFKFDGMQHNRTSKLLKLMNRRRNIYIHGPAGGGKSTAARKCAEALGLPYYYISLNPQSSPTRIEGYQTAHGEYVLTLFRKAYEFGGVFCADEVDNSSPNLWTSVNNAIDSDLGSFPDGCVQRHKDFIFVGTGNTNLSGDAVFRDRKALDKATISRFVFLFWDYDIKLEESIVRSINPKGIPWMKWVHKMRTYSLVQNQLLFAYCTPRASIDGAALIQDGFTADELAEMVLFKGTFDSTAKGEALKACPLPTL